MLQRLTRFFWGDLQGAELKKFALLSLGMFFIIGSFWPIKILKDSVFGNMIGPNYIPIVKILSLGFFFFLVMIYSRLVTLFSREKMMYLLVGVFATIGFICAYFLAHPTIGVSNTTIGLNRLFGWFFYMFVESYAGLLVALYWSFINDVTTPESARKGYGMIIFGSQVGGVSAMLVSNYFMYDVADYFAMVPFIVVCSMILLVMMGCVVWLFHRSVDLQDMQGYQGGESQKKDHFSIGFFEGLRLLITRPYVSGIFSIIFFHEFIATVMQFHMQILAKGVYSDPALYTRFLFNFGFIVQAIACIFSLFGTSLFQRMFGIRFSLIAYPFLLGLAIAGYVYNPTLQFITIVMVIAKAINYALNVPAKEMLYIPTSKDIRYKSKAWIDVFGARLSKGAGSFNNIFIQASVGATGGVALILIGLWIGVGHKLGTVFMRVTEKNQRIE